MPGEDLIHDDGEAHCPYDDCDWWVPGGMEYLFRSHELTDHDDPKRTIQVSQAPNGQWYATEGDLSSGLMDTKFEAIRGLEIHAMFDEYGTIPPDVEIPDGIVLPDEREAIRERGSELDELDKDELLTVDEVADQLGIDLDDRAEDIQEGEGANFDEHGNQRENEGE